MSYLEIALVGAVEPGIYRRLLTVASPGTSTPVRVKAEMTDVTVAVFPTGGISKIQFSLSPLSDVDGGTARWVDWDFGNVTQATADALASIVTAIRLVVTSGNCTMEVIAR